MLTSAQTDAARVQWEGILEDMRLADAGVSYANLPKILRESAKLGLALLASYDQDIQRIWGRDQHPVYTPNETGLLLGMVGETYPCADGRANDWALLLSGPLKDVIYLGRVGEGLDKALRITPEMAARLIVMLSRLV